jgi:protein involved in polysaccharide export with SLBB domain
MKQSLFGVILVVLIACITPAKAQMPSGLNLQNLSSVKVDDLSDQQIADFWKQAQEKGLSLVQLQQMATQRNMNPLEFAKLKSRIENLSNVEVTTGTSTEQSSERKYDGKAESPNKLSEEQSKVFGAELFSNKNLTFEPNLKIATPQGYQIGPDDELVIDISGLSDASYKLKVSPDGQIRIPVVGPVVVGGLTIEQAKSKIKRQLSNSYGGISSGETSVSLSLGNIRSIKVTILGEVNLPGTYTLPSLATALNALYASGGPNNNGSFRNISVIRNGKTIGRIDVYDFLLKGSSKANIRLQDQDVIKVNPYAIRVELTGEVKRPGLYEVAKQETLKDVIDFAGGFTDNAYRDRIKVYRNTAKEKSVADVPQDIIAMFVPQSGDVYTIDKVLERFSNRVQINGAVFRPGFFALDEGLTLAKLIAKADGLKEDAFTSRAVIYRLREDNSLEVISVDLNEVLSGKDVKLKREDNIQILSKLELREEYSVFIAGEVLKPGKYTFADNMRVEDLILTAGGLKLSAAKNKIEVARRIKDIDVDKADAPVSTILTYEVNDQLKTVDGKDIILQPFDVVSIYRLPGFQSQRNVTIEGEVHHPGQYTLMRNNERISEVLARSGGVTASGFPDGAVLLRTRKMTSVDQFIKRKKMQSVLKQSSDSASALEISNSDIGDATSIVGINLDKILKNPGSKYDLILEENDVIRIPRTIQTVKISGEVLYPLIVQYEKGKSFNYYVKNAGGYTMNGLKKKGYVVYANGSSYSTRKILFVFNNHPKIKPGAEIIIPAREERKKLSALEVVSITSSLATLVLLIYTITK